MAVEVLVIFVLWNIQEGECSVVLLGVGFVTHSIVVLLTPTAEQTGRGGWGVLMGFRWSWGTGYAAGIKQSREPMDASVYVAALLVNASASPADAP